MFVWKGYDPHSKTTHNSEYCGLLWFVFWPSKLSFAIAQLLSSHFHPCNFDPYLHLHFCFTPICLFTFSQRPICPIVFCWIRVMSCTCFLLQLILLNFECDNVAFFVDTPWWQLLQTFFCTIFVFLTCLFTFCLFLRVAVNTQSSGGGCFCAHAPTFCLLHNVFHRPLSSRCLLFAPHLNA